MLKASIWIGSDKFSTAHREFALALLCRQTLLCDARRSVYSSVAFLHRLRRWKAPGQIIFLLHLNSRKRNLQKQKTFLVSFIHLSVCLTEGPKPLPKRFLHTVRSRASSFKWQYSVLSLRSSSSFLRLPPRLPVTFIPPFTSTSITRCRRQFLHKMWPIQLAFRFLISCRIFLCSLTLSKISPRFWFIAKFFVWHSLVGVWARYELWSSGSLHS